MTRKRNKTKPVEGAEVATQLPKAGHAAASQSSSGASSATPSASQAPRCPEVASLESQTKTSSVGDDELPTGATPVRWVEPDELVEMYPEHEGGCECDPFGDSQVCAPDCETLNTRAKIDAALQNVPQSAKDAWIKEFRSEPIEPQTHPGLGYVTAVSVQGQPVDVQTHVFVDDDGQRIERRVRDGRIIGERILPRGESEK